MSKRTREERFWAKVNKQSEGCWLWIGARTADVYGMFDNQGAHRVSWELANGRKIRPGYQIHHTCAVTLCVRPEHLQEVTPSVNSQYRSERLYGVKPLPYYG